ncbi:MULTISPECIES: hypothetical protein [Nguyenibacter]|uniref:Uncharacterized protein n=1 Tax=Nguyenibacter vanlangensis TaxID=1216886 RepID=A0ABZ3DBD8_9PROT|nr:hypothetical protein [Nguyenibacter sp. L1]WRH90114.1 hypothetical protein QN315_04440 [Nguyenibacter sp. L1]
MDEMKDPANAILSIGLFWRSFAIAILLKQDTPVAAEIFRSPAIIEKSLIYRDLPSLTAPLSGAEKITKNLYLSISAE